MGGANPVADVLSQGSNDMKGCMSLGLIFC
jgi:hypothetical protein